MEVGAVATIPLFTFSKIVKFNTKPYVCRSLLRPPRRSTSAAQATSFWRNIDNPKCRNLPVFSVGSGSGECREMSEAKERSSAGPDVILLDVGGMTCGGCATSVKRILETQPQVSSASVNLATGTTIVSVVPPEVGVTHNWRKELGEKLASQLTICGFKSYVRVA